MKKSNVQRAGVFALICSVVVVLFSAAPLFDHKSDALVLTLFFGAFGAGVSFMSLVVNAKTNRGVGEDETKSNDNTDQ